MLEHLPFHIYTVGKTEQVTNKLAVIVAALPSKKAGKIWKLHNI